MINIYEIITVGVVKVITYSLVSFYLVKNRTIRFKHWCGYKISEIKQIWERNKLERQINRQLNKGKKSENKQFLESYSKQRNQIPNIPKPPAPPAPPRVSTALFRKQEDRYGLPAPYTIDYDITTNNRICKIDVSGLSDREIDETLEEFKRIMHVYMSDPADIPIFKLIKRDIPVRPRPPINRSARIILE